MSKFTHLSPPRGTPVRLRACLRLGSRLHPSGAVLRLPSDLAETLLLKGRGYYPNILPLIARPGPI